MKASWHTGLGTSAGATRLALSAYLDGFEPLEPALSARNKALLTQVESAMLDYRAAIAGDHPQQVTDGARKSKPFSVTRSGELDPAKAEGPTAFVGALTILLREGIEALLVVVGMIAFLKKAGRPEILRHVHAGWVGALAAGGLTWTAATYVVSISGASREMTEGVSSVFAAVVLLGVGLWMHQKSTAGRWQAYLKDKMSSAMSRRSAYAMAGLAFVAVYREVFETVLFFSALWTEGNGFALLLGLAAGAAVLAAIAWVLLRTSAEEDADAKVLPARARPCGGFGGGADWQRSQGSSGGRDAQRAPSLFPESRVLRDLPDCRDHSRASRCCGRCACRLFAEWPRSSTHSSRPHEFDVAVSSR